MNTVAKGANRAAHQQRTNRHAQRTPLPPRPGAVEAAREPVAKSPSLAVAAPEGGTRSLSKASAFQAKAEASGWDIVTDVAGDRDAVELTATRGAETMVQAWANGVWQYDASFYGFGDRTIRPRNAAGASKLLSRSESDAATEAGKVAANRHFRKAEPKDIGTKMEEAKQHLPFDPELDADELVLGALTGQALVWYNRLSRGTERAMVSRKGARMSRTPDGQRVVTFCCPATGYRSCLVTAILRVGRGRIATTKGAELASVEVDD